MASRAPWITFFFDLSFALSCLLLPPIFLASVLAWFVQATEEFKIPHLFVRIVLSFLVLIMSSRIWLHYRDPHEVDSSTFSGRPAAQKSTALVTLSLVLLALIGLLVAALGIIYVGLGWLIMSTAPQSEGVEYARHWGEYVPSMVMGGVGVGIGTLMVMPLVGRLMQRRPRLLPVSTAVPTTPVDVESAAFSASEKESKEGE